MAEKIRYYDVSEEQVDKGYWPLGCHKPTEVEAAVKIGLEMGIPVEIHRYGEVCRYLNLSGICEERRIDKRWFGLVVKAESCQQRVEFMAKFGELAMKMLEVRKK